MVYGIWKSSYAGYLSPKKLNIFALASLLTAFSQVLKYLATIYLKCPVMMN